MTHRLSPVFGALLAGTACADPAALATPPSCGARSGPHTATLVELYTSEGCSSCPPADRWLSQLSVARQAAGAAQSVAAPAAAGAAPADRAADRRPAPVLLAFHVDYWDRLGWRDRFAQPVFASRQEERSQATGGRFVYTPQVRIDGRDVRDWQRVSLVASPPHPAGATLELRAAIQGDRLAATLTGQLNARPGMARPGRAWLALTESGLSSNVRAGENAGARLQHDHVVRVWKGPFTVGADGALSASAALDTTGIDLALARLVAVVEQAAGPIEQALALPLATCLRGRPAP